MNQIAEKWEHHARHTIWRIVGTVTATLTLSTAIMTTSLTALIMSSAIGMASCAILLGVAGYDRQHRPGLTRLMMTGLTLARKQDEIRLDRKMRQIMIAMSSHIGGCAIGLAVLGMMSAAVY